MVRLSLAKLAAAVGGLTWRCRWERGRVRRSMDAIINTTCNYGR